MVAGGAIIADSGADEVDAENQPFTKLVARVAVLAALGGFLFGYDTGIVSGAMIYMQESLELDDIWKEIIVSITILAAWIFSMIAGPLATRYGRKKVVFVASATFIYGSIIMAVSQEKYSMAFGRFIVGAAVGLASMIVPMFIAEMAPSRHRGSLVTMNNLFITGGQAFASVVAGLLGRVEGDLSWRLMLGLAAVPAALQFIGFLTVPESPRWLMQVGREEEAKCTLQLLRGDDSIITTELEAIKRTCSSSNNADGAKHPTSTFAIIAAVLRDKHLRMALIVGCTLSIVQQSAGINTVMYYTATIIKMSGVRDKNTAVWMASATANINFLINFLGIYLVDRVGRRWLTLSSLVGVIFSLSLLAVGFQILDNTSPAVMENSWNRSHVNSKCFDREQFDTCSKCVFDEDCVYCYDENDWSSVNHCYPKVGGAKGTGRVTTPQGSACDKRSLEKFQETRVLAEDWCPSPYSWLVLVGLCVYLFCFGPGLGPMPWTINSELFPLWCRSTCYSITTAFSWLFNLLVSLTFLSLTRVIKASGAFWLYMSISVAGLIFFLFFLPETKGRSLESDIGGLLDKQEQNAKRRASESLRNAQRRVSEAFSPRKMSNGNRVS